ncbi:MAG: molybdate ABC transporter substrate-binding protein [Geminicoccaceae bacterium]
MAALGLAGTGRPGRRGHRLAAASLKNALDEVWPPAGRPRPAIPCPISYAGSARLARQIEQGAPADLFISANTAWMDHLDEAGLIDEASRRDLLGNRLVLVAHGRDAAPVDLAPGADLAHRLGDGRLAMALVDAVPAGIYGRRRSKNWASGPVADRTAQTDNVRAALALVAPARAPPSASLLRDRRRGRGRRGCGRHLPEDSHPPIVYPVALTVEGTGRRRSTSWPGSAGRGAGRSSARASPSSLGA